jgi:hypothetical protein
MSKPIIELVIREDGMRYGAIVPYCKDGQTQKDYLFDSFLSLWRNYEKYSKRIKLNQELKLFELMKQVGDLLMDNDPYQARKEIGMNHQFQEWYFRAKKILNQEEKN